MGNALQEAKHSQADVLLGTQAILQDLRGKRRKGGATGSYGGSGGVKWKLKEKSERKRGEGERVMLR